jgi:hypothetical protein
VGVSYGYVSYYICFPGGYGYGYGYGDVYGYGLGYGYDYGYCGWVDYYYETTYRDYSAFDATAVDTWSTEATIDAGSVSPEQGVATIKQAYESVLGAPIGGRDASGENGERARLDDPTYRRGFELFEAVLGIHTANWQDIDPQRDPTRRSDVVYVTGRRVLGFLPLHTALEYGGSTLSAFDSDESLLGNGVLVSRPNALSDRPPMMMTLGSVSSTLGAGAYWLTLVASDARYPDNLPYNPVPSSNAATTPTGSRGSCDGRRSEHRHEQVRRRRKAGAGESIPLSAVLGDRVALQLGDPRAAARIPFHSQRGQKYDGPR